MLVVYLLKNILLLDNKDTKDPQYAVCHVYRPPPLVLSWSRVLGFDFYLFVLWELESTFTVCGQKQQKDATVKVI